MKVKPVSTEQDLDTFLRFPWQIYRDDRHWVPPYLGDLKKRLDPQRNPFFRYASRELFLAEQDGEIVGTIGAIYNRQHVQQHQEQTGFFGFFECQDDSATAQTLIEAAEGWLLQHGMRHIRGPVNGALTDEIGVFIFGHQSRPAMWEGHNPPYYQRLIEDLNFKKFDDVFAYEITYDQLGRNLANAAPKLQHVALAGDIGAGICLRQVDMKRWDGEISALHYLYNTAFRTIDGHNDMSLEKFSQLAKSVRPFLDPALAQIAEHDGRPVGFAVALPDLNEALRHFNGSISRLGSLRLAWYVRRIRTACFKLLGVLPEYRGRGLEARLILEIARNMVRKKYFRMEISLASEKNLDSTRIIQRLGGQVYRQYRIYEREIK